MPELAPATSKVDPACVMPTTESISNLLRTAVYEFSDRDKRDNLRDQMYWQENEIPHPAHVDFQEVHTGTATEVVERLKGILNERPSVQVGYAGLSDLKSRNVEDVQEFLNGFWPATEDDADEDTWEYVLEDVLRFGRAYDSLEYVPARWSTARGYPSYDKKEDPKVYDQKRREFRIKAATGGLDVRLPVSWRHMPAKGVYAWKDEGGISECISVEQRRVADLGYRYDVPKLLRQVEMQGGGSASVLPVDHAIFVRYWNRKYSTYWISRGYTSRTWNDRLRGGESLLQMAGTSGDMSIQPFEHGYGQVPITETSGIMSTSKNPAKKQLSVMDHLMPLCMYYDQLVAQKATAVRMWAWPTPLLKNLGIGGQVINSAPIGDDMRPVPIEIIPGQLMTLLPGEEISWLIAPDNGAGSDQLMAFIGDRADALGISSKVFDAQALQANGYLFNSVVNSIRSKFNPIIAHVKRAHRNRCQLALKIVEMNGEPLYIFKPGDGAAEAGEFLGLSPEKIRGTIYQIATQYEDHMPMDDAADMGLYQQATDPANPAMTRKDAYAKYLRGKNPEKNADRLRIQKFEDSPLVEQFLQANAVKEAGLELDRIKQGNPQQKAANMPPDQAAQAPPALIQALQGAGVQLPQGGPPAPSGPGMGGGVPGLPVAPPIAGTNRPLIPPPPAQGNTPGTKPGTVQHGARRQGGRAAGQSRQAPRPHIAPRKF